LPCSLIALWLIAYSSGIVPFVFALFADSLIWLIADSSRIVPFVFALFADSLIWLIADSSRIVPFVFALFADSLMADRLQLKNRALRLCPVR
jgi:hypothetical protein